MKLSSVLALALLSNGASASLRGLSDRFLENVEMSMSMDMGDNMDSMDTGGSATFEVRLTADSEVAPFVGIESAFGTAVVDIEPKKACISTDIEGFAPAVMHIHFGAIDENGDILVDFTPLIKPMKPDTDGCVAITSELSERIIARPDLYYVNAHLGGTAPSILRAIRGQLVQGFTVPLENSQTVAPFDENVKGAMGTAAVSFQDAGATACFDVSMNVDDFVFGHVHNGVAGMNGPRVFNFTEVKVDNVDGRWFGCQDVTSYDVEGDVTVVKDLLADPSEYYFDFHIALTQPIVLTSIRGQLDGTVEH